MLIFISWLYYRMQFSVSQIFSAIREKGGRIDLANILMILIKMLCLSLKQQF